LVEGLGVRILGWFGLPTQTARQLIRVFTVGGFVFLAYVAVMAAVVDRFGGRMLLGAFLAFVIATLASFVGRGQATRLLSPLADHDLHPADASTGAFPLRPSGTSPVRRGRLGGGRQRGYRLRLQIMLCSLPTIRLGL